MSCDEVITTLAKTVREEFPDDRYQEVTQQFDLGDEANQERAARRLLSWLERDGARRDLLAQLANGSACKLSAAREVLAASRSLVTVGV